MKEFLFQLLPIVVSTFSGAIMAEEQATPTQSCIDVWSATTTNNAPIARDNHTAVWTGSEMIVWGGETNQGLPNAGWRYDPGLDTWAAISTTNAPTGRFLHTAVWTGTEMIVWGGSNGTNDVNTGGRYNPSTNTWTATSITNAPAGRESYTAIWTGSEMIVWGGYNGSIDLSSGGRYNPSTDTWTALTNTNAPVGRSWHTAVWTGSEMIVWGGSNNGNVLGTGGKYNPGTNTWTATNTLNAPSARSNQTAVWTGSEMIIWSGYDGSDEVNSGGKYNPGADTWTITSVMNAPGGRNFPSAVWTGSEMIAWGGYDPDFVNTGGRYKPDTDAWTLTTTSNVPAPRAFHTAVWTGNQMIVWGGSNLSGFINTGGRYCGQSSTTPTPSPTPPATPTPTPTPPHTPTPTPTPTPSPTHTPTPTPTIPPTPTPTIPPTPTATPTPTPSATPATTPTTFGNISTRLRVETGDNVLIGGFIVTGTQPKKVIVRAIGPSLPFPGVLADPFLELRDSSGTLIRANNNWRDEQEAEIIATMIPPSNDLESAVVATLPANAAAYTATVSGVNNGTGIGVVEVYDLNQAVNSKLANISTRGLVQTGDNVLIGGLIVLGQDPLRVILRAIGPSLPVPGALADPMLELHDGNGTTIAANDNWRSDQEAEIVATGIPPTNDLESAIVRSLPPGNYTGIVSGVNNTTGVGLVEAYNLSN